MRLKCQKTGGFVCDSACADHTTTKFEHKFGDKSRNGRNNKYKSNNETSKTSNKDERSDEDGKSVRTNKAATEDEFREHGEHIGGRRTNFLGGPRTRIAHDNSDAMGKSWRLFQNTVEELPGPATPFLASSSNSSGRARDRIRMYSRQSGLDSIHYMSLLDSPDGGCKDCGGRSDVPDESDCKNVLFHGKRRESSQTDGTSDSRPHSGNVRTFSDHGLSETGNSSSPMFHPRPANRRHFEAPTSEGGIGVRSALTHGVHDSPVCRGENSQAAGPVHATSACDLKNSSRLESTCFSFGPEDLFWRGQSFQCITDQNGDQEVLRRSLPAVDSEGRTDHHGAKWCITPDPPPPFQARIRGNAHALPGMGRKFLPSRTGISGRWVLQPADRSESYPLHIKRVPPLFEEDIMKAMSPPELSQYKIVRSYFEETFLRQVPCNTSSTSDLSDEDIQQLIDAKLIEQCDQPSFPTPGLHVFTIPEHEKKRRRLICHTVDINTYSQPDTFPSTTFHNMEELLKVHVTRQEQGYVWAADIASCHHQYEIDCAARKYFCFPSGSRGWFCLRTIATGQRHCVVRAQLVALFLASRCLPAVTFPYERGTPDVYIDNFFCSASSLEETEKQIFLFKQNACRYNITLNEIIGPTTLTNGLTHRGVEFGTCAAGFVRAKVAAKTIAKLHKARCLLQDDSLTFLEAQQIFGLSQYASRIHGTPLFTYYHVFKFMRRRGRLHSAGLRKQEEPTRIWPSIAPLWDQWLSTLINGYRPTDCVDSPLYRIVSDASNTGFGAVIFPPSGRPEAFSGTWPAPYDKRHINEKELLALVLAAKETPPGSHLSLKVDNTTALQCVTRTRSRSFELNRLVCFLLTDYTVREITYVPSAANIADGLSRGEPHTELPLDEPHSESLQLGVAKPIFLDQIGKNHLQP